MNRTSYKRSAYKHYYNDEWIIENYLEYPSYKKLAIDHNELFGTTITDVAMKAYGRKLGLNKPRQYGEFTEEQKKWLQSNYHLLGVRETQRQFNEKFNTNRTYNSIKNFGFINCKPVETEVATRNKRAPHYNSNSKRCVKEIGSIRNECGRWVMKADDGTWSGANRVIYKKEYGDIPQGHDVIFLDGDVNNLDINNLLAIPREYQGLLLKYNLRSENKDITKVAVTWCELYETLKKENALLVLESEE